MNAFHRPHFQDLLLNYSRESDATRRKEIDAELWREFGTEQAVLVLDMSGFSQLSLRHGVVHYLSMVRRMQLTSEPIVREHGGILVKFEADNCFAMFPQVAQAVRACIALNLAFDAANFGTPDELDIRIACGIDFGPILVIDGNDFFGNPVNRASKLGEDLAGPGEILLTQAALDLVAEHAGLSFQPQRFTISGIEILAHSVIYK